MDHLGFAHIDLGVELAQHAADDDFQVQLPHTRQDHLAGILVGAHPQGRVFGYELIQDLFEFFLVTVGFRLNGNRDNRLVKLDSFQQHRVCR